MASAHDEGYGRGQNAGSWVIDGNTTVETARRILAGYNNGDPEIMDMAPAPLSGEWAGESIPELSEEYGLDLEDDDEANAFEEGFSEGFWDEVVRSARAMLESEPTTAHTGGEHEM